MKTGTWILSAGVLAVAVLAAAPASAQNDSAIVNASRAARKREGKQKPTHVYTNDDFPQNPVQSQDTSATVPEAKTSGASTSAKPAPADGKAQTSKEKVAALEAKLAESKKYEQALQNKLNELKAKADTEKSVDRRNMYLEMISDQQPTLAKFRQDETELEKQIQEEKDKESPDKNKSAD